MRLLIDIGNTRAKWAITTFQGFIQARGVLAQSGVFERDSLLDGLLDGIQEAWVSCVGKPEALERVVSMVKSELNLDVSISIVEPHLGELSNGYNDLQRLGVDRWVAALGARSVVPEGALIIVDAGTAVTVDLVSSDNVFEGGVILPGLTMMHDSLVGKTAGISSELRAADSVVGKTTQECVNAGVLFGLVGAIERVVAEISEESNEVDIRLLICGGDAMKVQANSKLPLILNSDLIFHGLNLMSHLKSNQ